MRKSFILCLLTSLLALATGTARASDSLYDKKTARKPDSSQFSFFGPLSGRFKYDSRMLNAAKIAQDRARAHSTSRCWRYVKDALLAAKAITTRPKTVYAKQAGQELSRDFGFKKLRVSDPYKAPIGSVVVYGGRGAGHVEIRTARGFVSDFETPKASPRPLLGVYIKPRA
jgi:hypothetical protein